MYFFKRSVQLQLRDHIERYVYKNNFFVSIKCFDMRVTKQQSFLVFQATFVNSSTIAPALITFMAMGHDFNEYCPNIAISCQQMIVLITT